jgi:hypothetical protein
MIYSEQGIFPHKGAIFMADELSVTEASRLVLVSPSYIIKQLKFGNILGHKVGTFWVVDKASLEAWDAKRKKKRAVKEASERR